MNFREATVEDIAPIHVVRNAVIENKLSNPDLITHNDYVEFLTVRGKGWVCEIDGQIVGFSIADLEEENIWALFLLPEFEGKGIGRQLQDLMLSWYFSNEKDNVWLGTSPKTRAAEFYRKSGWIENGNNGQKEIKFEMTKEIWMNIKNIKPEFWESAFGEKQEMWGFEPSNSAVLTKDFFIQNSVKNILIPGIGYGRNAQIFKENGIAVTGIEISKTAIEMARKHYGTDMVIYHGSVTDMPFDQNKYDGIFCYALIHLLDSSERNKLILDCYNQLSENGYMVFTVISKAAHTYGQGKFVSKDRYEIFDGVDMFFYDRESIKSEFDKAGLFEITEINESQPFFLIKCRKSLVISAPCPI